MSSTALPCITANPALLLIEPEVLGYSERAAQLDRSEFCVTRAGNPKDIFLMRHAFQFSVAVLSDLMGFLPLQASAQLVRRQWPGARVLILGCAPQHFQDHLEDHLYDETILHSSDEDALLLALDKLIEDPWNQRRDDKAAQLARARLTPHFASSWNAEESDPTKVKGHTSEMPVARSWPANARKIDRVH